LIRTKNLDRGGGGGEATHRNATIGKGPKEKRVRETVRFLKRKTAGGKESEEQLETSQKGNGRFLGIHGGDQESCHHTGKERGPEGGRRVEECECRCKSSEPSVRDRAGSTERCEPNDAKTRS